MHFFCLYACIKQYFNFSRPRFSVGSYGSDQEHHLKRYEWSSGPRDVGQRSDSWEREHVSPGWLDGRGDATAAGNLLRQPAGNQSTSPSELNRVKK